MPFFSGVVPWHKNFTLSCVISLSDSATAHSPSGWVQPFLSGRCPFIRSLHLGIQISLYPASSLVGTQQRLTHVHVKSSSLLLWKNHFFQGLFLCNLLILSCPGSFWFGNPSYYTLNPYVYLCYLWSIS